jgi:hypothetical protein
LTTLNSPLISSSQRYIFAIQSFPNLPKARGNLLASGFNPFAINQAVQAQLSLAAVAQRQFAQLNQRLLPQSSQVSTGQLHNVPQMFRNFIQNDLKTPEQSSKRLLSSSKKITCEAPKPL